MTQFLALSNAADADPKIHGLHTGIFESGHPISVDTNILYLVYQDSASASLESGGEQVFAEIPEISSAKNNFRKLVLSGLGKIKDGCASKTMSATENEIQAGIVAISSNLDIVQKKECILTSLPIMFGLMP